MPKFEITVQGVTKLLEFLNGERHPDQTSSRIWFWRMLPTKYLNFLELFLINLYRRANYQMTG